MDGSSLRVIALYQVRGEALPIGGASPRRAIRNRCRHSSRSIEGNESQPLTWWRAGWLYPT
jgi:hypothetical protein